MTNETFMERSIFKKSSVADIASQICLIDMEIFKNVKIEELDSFNWTKQKTRFKSPSIIKFTRQFNKIYFWVLKEIIEINQMDVNILIKFIKLAKKLSKLRDFFSAYAIMCALNSCSMKKFSWTQLPTKYTSQMNYLSNLYSIEENMAVLDKEMDIMKIPCVPYIGLYQSHLIRIDTLFPSKKEECLSERTKALNKIYDCIKYYQGSSYSFKIIPKIREYIETQDFIDGVEQLIMDKLLSVSNELYDNSNGDSSPANNASPTNTMNRATDSPTSISTQNTTTTASSISFGKADLFNTHRKTRSHEEESGIYRKISDIDRQISLNPVTNNFNTRQSSKPPEPILNLVDDSEVPIPSSTPNKLGFKKPLSHSKSAIGVGSNLSPVSSPNSWGSLKRIKYPQRVSDMLDYQLNNPECDTAMLYKCTPLPADKPGLTMIIQSGMLICSKRPKSTICLNPPTYTCLVELSKLKSSLDCFLTLYNCRAHYEYSHHDDEGSLLLQTSLIDEKVQVKYENSKTSKIILILPNEIYQFKSIKDGTIPLSEWWKQIQDTITNVKNSIHNANQEDLINLEDDFTRL